MPALGFQDRYLALDESVRGTITLSEFSWLSNAQKDDLEHGATTPDDDAEDGPE